jgi:hypothetical protein
MRAPEWTGPELGHAAKGMPERSWRALAWAIGQEQAAHLWLKYELLQVAVELKQEEAWPRRVHRGNCPDCHALRCRDRYLEDLCVLALAELAAPTRGWTDETRSRWFGTKEASWKRGISQCYQSLSSAVTSWYDGGIRHLRERLRGT